MPLRFIHVVENDNILFFMTEWRSIICTHDNFLILSFTDGQSGSFYVVSTVKNAAVNVGVPIYIWINVFVFFE